MRGVGRWAAAAILTAATACSSVLTDKPPGETRSGQCGDPGRVTLHRLNRTEYDNTVRDLLAVNLKLGRDFPAEDLGEGFDNIADVLTMAPLLVEKYDEAATKLVDAALDPGSTSRKKLLVCTPSAGDEAACATRVLAAFLPRAFRRAVPEDEVARYVSFVSDAVTRGDGFETGLRHALQAALVSPHFLFRVEKDPESGTRNLDGYEVASRLSFFLWSSMPDDELFAAAKSGGLDTPEGIEAQVTRMLRDPRAHQAIVDNFAGQWLATRALATAQPDTSLFPDWNEALRESMAEETKRVFTEILDEKRSLLDLLDAEFTWVNGPLAAHYGIAGVHGDDWVRVEAPKDRAGILGHGAFLTLTSNPTRTSPVKRGKWVMAQLLCSEPPPPPAGVEGLPEGQANSGSVREEMEAHRANPDCAVCHVTMDSIGFGFERFGPTGELRNSYADGTPIDSSGELPGGRIFDGAVELAKTLRADPALESCMASHALTWALGRALTNRDRCTVEGIRKEFAAGGHSFEALARAIAGSDAFRMRSAEKGEGK